MSRNWTVGDRIAYGEIVVNHDELVQEQRFGWEVLGPIAFDPGTLPPFEVMVANSVHTNPKIARRYGLRDAVVPGVRLFAYICDMFLKEFGIAWAEGGALSVKFVAPAMSGDILHTFATVKEIVSTANGTQLTFHVAVINQHDEQLVQGKAQIGVQQ